MDANTLLRALPPYEYAKDVIVKGNQTIDDIELLVLRTHDVTADHYDKIARYFDSKDAPKKLFNFVSTLRYNEEPGQDQTTRSPAGILVLADEKGIDCKHMAAFIAGVLDALNRTGKHFFDWYYRFVSYKKKERKAEHVYVVLKDQDIWIDPAPIKDRYTGRYHARYFNDRMAIPTFFTETSLNMLSYLHGVHYRVTDDNPANSTCMGAVEPDQLGLISEIKDVAGQVASVLPEGGLKEFLSSFFDNPAESLKTLFTGRTYNTGEYVAAERYMRNILGMMEIQNRRQVPDEYVPQALVFFSAAFGIPISSDDHLQALTRSVGDYKNWAGGTFSWVDTAQVERARNVLTQQIGWTTTYHPRDVRWPLSAFGAYPYIFPIHNPSAGTGMAGRSYFTGVHPILNIYIENGYPQQTTIPEPPPVQTTQPPPPPGQTTIPPPPGQTTIPPPPGQQTTKKAGMNLLLMGAIAAGVLYAANKGGKK